MNGHNVNFDVKSMYNLSFELLCWKDEMIKIDNIYKCSLFRFKI